MSRWDLRRLARLGLLGLPCLGAACTHTSTAPRTMPSPMLLKPSSPVDFPMGVTKAEPAPELPATVRAAQATAAPAAKQPLPISLDAVLRLAEEQNPQIAVARAKVCTAFAEKEAAAAGKWLPDIFMGVGYWRHAGGIQLQEGPLVYSNTGAFHVGPQMNAEFNPRDYAFRQLDAARKVWQNRGEMAKVSYEQLLDASTTYVDLLAAHAALAVSQEYERKATPILEKVRKNYNLAEGTADVAIEKARVEAEITQQQQQQLKLRGLIEAASAKLCYLLGLDQSVELAPVDAQMAAFNVVDASQPVDALVGQALAGGPGVRELEGILCLIQSGLDSAGGRGRLLPVVQLQMGEGLFGAGPGGTMAWSNRWDMGLQARWNISEALTAKYKKKVGLSQMTQAQLTYQELRAKLTLGVHEARSTIEATAAQFPSAEKLIKDAKEAVTNTEKIFNASAALPTERRAVTESALLQAHKAVALAQLNYIDQMREYDKAQLRLLVLLGGAGGCAAR